MATMIRGMNGEPHTSLLAVCSPTFNPRLGEYEPKEEVQIVLEVAHEQPVRIVLADDEVLQLIAQLAERLEKRINPPTPPEQWKKPVELGGNIV